MLIYKFEWTRYNLASIRLIIPGRLCCLQYVGLLSIPGNPKLGNLLQFRHLGFLMSIIPSFL